jgi:hypothetical protein
MEKEQFYNFEGENSYLGFTGEEDEFDGFIGIAKIKRLKDLTNAEEARLKQIQDELKASGVSLLGLKPRAKAKLLLEIEERRKNEVEVIAKKLRSEKKATLMNARSRANRIWQDARKKQLEQESLAEAEVTAQNAPQLAQPGLGKVNVKLPKGALAKALASMKFATKEDRDAYIASQTQGETKNLNAGALPESPVADVADESTSTMVTPTVGTNTNEGSEKPNYMLWTGIGLAVLTLGFLAYRKYYTK